MGGVGEHDWLWVEKSCANTVWVAEQLARHARIAVRDVGYAGLKDRRAIARQWFSVRRPSAGGTDWAAFAAEGVQILEQRRHGRKLRRAAHRGNAFRIALRSDDIAACRGGIKSRLSIIRDAGVPNYFGEQRFGRNGSSIELGRAVLAGDRLRRNKRSIGISALRSLEFNNGLHARVRNATWNRLLAGDIANLDSTGSVFSVDEVTPELERRCAEMDIHPAGVLPGFDRIRVAASYRPLRMRVSNLHWSFGDGVLWLEFSLGRGSYATAVLRELAAVS